MEFNNTVAINHNRKRRSVSEINKEYLEFVNLYKNGLTPFEIMRKINISKVQYKNYFADAIIRKEIVPANHEYGTCFGRHLPEAIRTELKADKEDLIRFKVVNEGVLLIKLEKD